MSRRILLLSLALFLVFLSCSRNTGTNGGEPPEPLTPVDLLPLDNEISGWTRDGVPETAEDSQELWDMIDGAGQVYMDNGFVECARQIYDGVIQGNGVKIKYLYVFDQGSADKAEAVYDDERSGMGTAWTENAAGTEARIDDSALFAYTIDFWQEKYFVKLTIEDKSNEALEVLKMFARNVSDKIP